MNDYTDDQKMHHYMGIEMNNETWNLLDKKERSGQDDLRMVMFAKASLYHWKKSPKFQHINEQRGEWMISRVFAVLGKGEKALSHAEKTMVLTKKYGFFRSMSTSKKSVQHQDSMRLGPLHHWIQQHKFRFHY